MFLNLPFAIYLSILDESNLIFLSITFSETSMLTISVILSAIWRYTRLKDKAPYDAIKAN